MKIYLCVLIVVMLTTGCLGITTPEPKPLVIERKCIMPEPFEKPMLPIVKYVKEGENGCTYYRCLTKPEAQNAVDREAEITGYANKMLRLYIDNKERCTE